MEMVFMFMMMKNRLYQYVLDVEDHFTKPIWWVLEDGKDAFGVLKLHSTSVDYLIPSAV